ncbi:hypothetical protein MXB_2527 [Myxobolus squamalis]|nr:hypothetical protein MXB_2527 [Myxobolus squamalis]
MNPWKKYRKDLTYLKRKYESIKDNSELTLNEYDSIMTDNEENIKHNNSSEILKFSKWVHKKNSDVITDNSYESNSLLSNSFEFEQERRNIISSLARKNPPNSPVKVTKEEFDDWLQPKSDTLLDDTIDDGMKQSSDLLTRISNLERHLCELIQVNRALIESGDPGEGIPMPQLCGNYDSSVISCKQSPPWKRNCSNRGIFIALIFS